MKLLASLLLISLLTLAAGTASAGDCACQSAKAACGCKAEKSDCGCKAAKSDCGCKVEKSGCGCAKKARKGCSKSVSLLPQPSGGATRLDADCCPRAEYKHCCEAGALKLLCKGCKETKRKCECDEPKCGKSCRDKSACK